MRDFLDLGSSRSKVQPGDVVFCQWAPDSVVVARVIRDDARWAYTEDSGTCLLMYFFRGELSITQVESLDTLPRGHLSPQNLMFPPVLTNTQGWRHGLFKTIGNIPISSSDVLPAHCFFESNRGMYFDEFANELKTPIKPVGSWGLAGYKLIEMWIDRALDSTDGTTATPG